MSLDQNPVSLEAKPPVKVELKDYELLNTLGAGKAGLSDRKFRKSQIGET